jgi:hypothetical protein
VNELPDPTWRLLLGRGLPTFAIDAVLPVALFYGVWRAAGLAPAVVVTSVAGGMIVLWQVRRGYDVALAGVTCVFLVIQAVVALVAHSATVYLAQPVVLSAFWGLAYLGSVAIGKPLIGASRERGTRFRPSSGRACATGASSGCSRWSGAFTVSRGRVSDCGCCFRAVWAGSSPCRS